MAPIIPAGHIVKLDATGTRTAVVGDYHAIDKLYTLLDESNNPLPGAYKHAKWWDPQPPGGAASSRAAAPAPAAPAPKAPKAPAPKAPAAPAPKAAPAPAPKVASSAKRKRAGPLPSGTMVKLDKHGERTAKTGEYDFVSKRYTLYVDGKLLPGSYPKEAWWVASS